MRKKQRKYIPIGEWVSLSERNIIHYTTEFGGGKKTVPYPEKLVLSAIGFSVVDREGRFYYVPEDWLPCAWRKIGDSPFSCLKPSERIVSNLNCGYC